MAYIVALCVVGGHRTGYIQPVIFPECRDVPFFRGHQPVRQPCDVLAGLFRYRVCLLLLGEQRRVLTLESIDYVVERQRVSARYAVIQSQRGIPVVVVRPHILPRLLSGTVQWMTLPEPVVFIMSRINICRKVAVVICRHYRIKAAKQQIALAVFKGRHQGISLAVLFAEHRFLSYASLYVLVHVRECEAEKHPVRPFLIDHAEFCHDSLVMVRVVEALHVLWLAYVDSSCLEILDRGIDIIIVVGIILKGVNLVCEAIFQGLSEIDI